jgi:hypothetical protein
MIRSEGNESLNEELSLDLYVKTVAMVAEIHVLVLTIITPSHR